jgi:hypothetical protein
MPAALIAAITPSFLDPDLLVLLSGALESRSGSAWCSVGGSRSCWLESPGR